MIYKLQLWTLSGEVTGEGEFKDVYFDVSQITGFYIPENDDEFGDAINILFNGDLVTIKQEPHIIKYLTENFVETAIENK